MAAKQETFSVLRYEDWGLGLYRVTVTTSDEGNQSRSEAQYGATVFGGGLNAAGFHGLTEQQALDLLLGKDVVL